MRFLISLILCVFSVVAMAAEKRAPLYQYAREHGIVGEKPNGYLGFVTSTTDPIRRTILDINIKRRALYTEKAMALHLTVESYANMIGCLTVLKTVPGEKYMSPTGHWLTRTQQEPLRRAECQ